MNRDFRKFSKRRTGGGKGAMDVNELAEREIAAIDAAIRALKAGKTSGQISARAVQRKLDELIGAKLRREKLVLAGPRGLALVA